MATAGCGGAKPTYLAADPLRDRSSVIGTSVEKRPIRMVTMGNGPDTVLIMATIHGDENAGTPLTLKLIEHLDKHPELLRGRRVLLIPVTNPDGYFHNRRTNVNRVDLNRNFPAANRRENARSSGAAPLSEPESRAIFDLLKREKPARIVSMHEPLKVIDWDGPGEALARHMGRYCSLLPVERLGSRPGSLGSHAGEESGIPIITLEFPKGAGKRPAADLWRDYGACLVAAITYPDGVSPELRP